MVDGGEAFRGLVTVIGSGGLVTIIAAFLAFRSEAHKGRRGEPEGRVVALNVGDGARSSGTTLDRESVIALTNAITTQTGIGMKILAQLEEDADRRALDEKVEDEIERRTRRESREMRQLAEVQRQEADRQPRKR